MLLVSDTVGQIVVYEYNRSWRKRGADLGQPLRQIIGKSRGDQLVRVTVEHIVVKSTTNQGQNRGGDQQF